MKIQELDGPVAGTASAETPPGPIDHRVVVPLAAAAPGWQRARLGPPDPTAPDTPSPNDKEPT